MNCGVGHRHSSDLVLLWLWHRPAAVAPIRPLAWEPPYAAGVALKRQKKKRHKINCFSVLGFFFFRFFSLGKVKGKKINTMIGNKTIMSQCGFTALEDSDASPVSVTL